MNLVASNIDALLEAANAPSPLTVMDSAMKYRTNEWSYEVMREDSTILVNNPALQSYFDTLDLSDLGAATRANMELNLPDTALALVESAQVQPVSSILKHHKDVQETRVNDAWIDALELGKLQSIAMECEELGGNGVNIARSMLAAEGIFVWDDPECEDSLVSGKKPGVDETNPSNGLTAECWPNPSSGRIYLRFSVAEAQGKLMVFDATGKSLLSTRLIFAGKPLEIDASNWAQGLLMVQVELEDGGLFTWRVVLER